MIEIPAELTSIRFTKDRCLSLGFHTQELSDEEKLEVSRYHNQFGYLLFKENRFQESEVPTDDAFEGEKSPSKRLRAVLYVYWQQKGGTGDFNQFYRQKMESLINMVKEKLI